MTILLRSATPPKTRNRTGVATLVKTAPAGQQSLEWWLAWLKAHWT